MSGMGSPSVKAAGESTPNGISYSSGAIRVAPSAKSEAVQGRIPSKCLSQLFVLPHKHCLSMNISIIARAERLYDYSQRPVANKGVSRVSKDASKPQGRP
jgi:hypothetical protein